jgi:hypothetical protein
LVSLIHVSLGKNSLNLAITDFTHAGLTNVIVDLNSLYIIEKSEINSFDQTITLLTALIQLWLPLEN